MATRILARLGAFLRHPWHRWEVVSEEFAGNEMVYYVVERCKCGETKEGLKSPWDQM